MARAAVVCKPHPAYTGFWVRIYKRDPRTGEGTSESFEMSPFKSRSAALRQAREVLKTEQGQESYDAVIIEARSMVNCRRA